MTANILTPAAALVVWTLVMLLWLVATRGPAIGKVGADKIKRGARGIDLDGVLDDKAQWKAHNYDHLLEQPTIFYAAVFILALSGYRPLDVLLAWAYVALRVVHSLWQATVNRQPARAILFVLSSVFVVALAIRALLVTL
jgi:hypothetical protein